MVWGILGNDAMSVVELEVLERNCTVRWWEAVFVYSQERMQKKSVIWMRSSWYSSKECSLQLQQLG